MINVIKDKYSNLFSIDRNNQYLIALWHTFEWQMIASELTSLIKDNQLILIS